MLLFRVVNALRHTYKFTGMPLKLKETNISTKHINEFAVEF